MSAERARLLFLNFGHGVDHFFMLVFATAVIGMEGAFGMSYGELLIYATPGFILFGAASIPAGWLGDRWSRNAMLTVFFIGIGAASILTGLAETPLQLGMGLALIGLFAAIYHPVGIPMVVQGAKNVGWRVGVNGVWGNMGVAAAPIVTAFIAATWGWREAFIVPGLISVLCGFGFWVFVRSGRCVAPTEAAPARKKGIGFRAGWQRVLGTVAIVTMVGGFIFNSTTVSLPKVFDVRMGDMLEGLIGVGALAAVVYAVASFAQLVVGRAVDRYPVRPILVTVVSCQLVLLFVVAQADGWFLFGAALLMMAFVFGQIPIADTLITRYTPDAWRGRVFSVKYILNLGVSAFAVPSIAVLYMREGGFETLFTVLGIGAVVMTITAVVLLARVGERPEPAPAE